MNKKSSLYLLIVLIAIIVIPSVASVISQRNNINDVLPFQTSESINETSRFKNKYKRNKGNKARSRNLIVPPFVSVANPNHNYPVGLLLSGNESTDDTCTASVINTSNGNIGLTAAHCLLDDNGNPWNLSFLLFSPGYDNRSIGPLGSFPVADIAIPHNYFANPIKYDYALMRFEFNHGGARLQDYTGALGWRFDIGNGEPTSFHGYPGNGDFENCTKDGRHLCKWQGVTEKSKMVYFIKTLIPGDGSSGGPFISQYNAVTNLGYLYALMHGYAQGFNFSVASIWDKRNFLDLLLKVTP
ncbi:34668_t:CDS:1 [Gigaspora margarita]|uniref:34668_t:CDS:1 n=1 Tax=Gigaspora margarita TaxID=4874 RepID=A0ABN7WQ37_GIGMA|nr:34668_t:CDS:1 [Gigaspora margarita]